MSAREHQPLHTNTYSSGWTKTTWSRTHQDGCATHDPGNNGDWDCDCRAVTWTPPETATR